MSTLRRKSIFGISKRLTGEGILNDSPLDQRRLHSTHPSVLVTHLEPDKTSVDDVLQRAGSLWGARPILVITDAKVRAMLGTGIAFEHLPSARQIISHKGAGDWRIYLQQRWRMIHTKWRPLYTIHVAMSYDEYQNSIEERLLEENNKEVQSELQNK